MAKLNHVYKALKDFEQKVIKASREKLKKLNKDSTGKLSQSIEGDVQEFENSIRIFFKMEDYGFYQDQGVKGIKSNYIENKNSQFQFKKGIPNTKMINSLETWIKNKGMKGRDKKTGRFITNKSLTFILARSIFNKGIKASYFFTEPFNRHFEKLPDLLIDKYGLDMEELFDDIVIENFKKLNNE